ncbi:MAG: DNA-3-methyladenine glycosylase [Candidatus Aenigmatarchaeota archaeon]
MMLKRKFFERNPKQVAIDLLGKVLVRKLDKKLLEGIIVETEAYFGLNDPASRAFHGRKNYNKEMWEEPGKIFIYNVHNNWMFNIVAHEKNEIGAVLIRAVHPIKGIEEMKRNRKVKDIIELTNGPGKLTKALKIDKSFNGKFLSPKNLIYIEDRGIKPEFLSSHRIGVKKDLEEELRFFVVNDPFVSR